MFNLEVGVGEYGVVQQAIERAQLATAPQLFFPKHEDDGFGTCVWEHPTDADVVQFRLSLWRNALELATFAIVNGDNLFSAEELLATAVLLDKFGDDPLSGQVSL